MPGVFGGILRKVEILAGQGFDDPVRNIVWNDGFSGLVA